MGRRISALLGAIAILGAPRVSSAGLCDADTVTGGPKVFTGDPDLKQVADRGQWIIYDPLLVTPGLRIAAESDLRQGSMQLATNDQHTGYLTSIAAGDFDEDGWVDLIAASDATRRVMFMRNRTAENAAPAWYATPLAARTPRFVGCQPGVPQANCSTFIADDLPLYAAVSTVAGDFDNDGHQDFVVMKICERCTFNEKPCIRRMYLGSGDGTFAPHYTPFSDTDVGELDWTGTTMQAADWDGDGWLDILVAEARDTDGLSDAEPRVLLLTNDGTAKPMFKPSVLITGPAAWKGSGADDDISRRGFTTVAGGLFDADEYADIIVGSVAHDVLLYYPGMRNGTFDTPRNINPGNVNWPLSANAILGMPWDSRGLDLIVATDNWNYGCATTMCATDTTYGGYVHLLRRKDLFATPTATSPVRFERWQTTHTEPHFTQGFNSVDWDSAAALDYDNDPEQMVDIVLAEGHPDVSLFAMRNGCLYTGAQGAPIYPQCTGDTNYTAWSPPVRPVDDLGMPVNSAVHSFCLTVDETLPAGTDVTYEMTNDNGVTSVQGTCAASAGQRICCAAFDLPGNKLRWRARLCPSEDGSATPEVTEVSVGLAGEPRRLYSGAPVISEGLKYAPAFAADGFDGRLFAFRIDHTGADTQLWEAGAILDVTADGSRKIYTATCSGSPCTWTMIEFSTANASDAALQALLGAADTTEATDIIKWTRSDRFGTPGNPHRLGALLSGTPAVLRPPLIPPWHDSTQIDAAEQTKITDFRALHASRPRLVFAGASDGMLHAFFTDPDDDAHAANGKEVWAFIPPDVASRLNQDRLSGLAGAVDVLVDATAFMDGSPLLADVPDPSNSNDYMTVLVSGLGSGGSSLFALDVTDTVNADGSFKAVPTLLWSESGGPNENWGHSRAPASLIRRPPISPVAQYFVAFATGRGAPGLDVGDTIRTLRIHDGSTAAPAWETHLDPFGFND